MRRRQDFHLIGPKLTAHPSRRRIIWRLLEGRDSEEEPGSLIHTTRLWWRAQPSMADVGAQSVKQHTYRLSDVAGGRCVPVIPVALTQTPVQPAVNVLTAVDALGSPDSILRHDILNDSLSTS